MAGDVPVADVIDVVGDGEGGSPDPLWLPPGINRVFFAFNLGHVPSVSGRNLSRAPVLGVDAAIGKIHPRLLDKRLLL